MKTYPSPAELYSLELRARRMRQQEIGRMLRKGARAVKAAVANLVSHFSTKGIRHA